MSSPPITPCIQPNPDVSGIGVRVSVYAQAFLIFIRIFIIAMDGKITKEESSLLLDMLGANELTVCALLISAIIQAKTYGLSTYHANIVLALSWITFLPTLPANIIYKHFRDKQLTNRNDTVPETERTSNSKDAPKLEIHNTVLPQTEATSDSEDAPKLDFFRIEQLALCVHYTTVAWLGIWVWSDVKSFGYQPQCTPQTFVDILGFDFFVTNPMLKYAALFLYGLAAINAVGATTILLFGQLLLKLRYSLFRKKAGTYSPIEGTQSEPPPTAKRWVELAWIGFWLLGLGVEISLVASTEVLITRSKGLVFPGESQWTLGQSLAVGVVVIPLVSTIRELRTGFKDLREKKRDSSRLPAADDLPLLG